MAQKKVWIVLALLGLLSSGCSSEVGSKAWCQEIKEKPKAGISPIEAKDFAKFCIF